MDKGFLNALKESMQIQREQIERNIEAEKPLNVRLLNLARTPLNSSIH